MAQFSHIGTLHLFDGEGGSILTTTGFFAVDGVVKLRFPKSIDSISELVLHIFPTVGDISSRSGKSIGLRIEQPRFPFDFVGGVSPNRSADEVLPSK